VKKNELSSNILSTCPHNMVNFGPLVAEIGPVVWGTPANFNGFRALAALPLSDRDDTLSYTPAYKDGINVTASVVDVRSSFLWQR